MELPQPRPVGSQEGSKQTHDFLSIYEPLQQDPSSPHLPPQERKFLRTQEFLQPLPTLPTQEEGKGTMNKNNGNSSCSSYTVNGFTLWERSAMTKENVAITEGHITGEGEWLKTESSSNNSNSNYHHLANTSLSSPQAKKNKTFMDILKSAKISHDQEDVEDEQEIIIKDEPFSNHTIDAKKDDQKPCTARSKHSATEQRRRSKINDRFQSLRELIPRNDQKRDKASFLLEVIEYIQYLQKKVQTYEGAYQRWNQLEPWASFHNNKTAGCSNTSQLVSLTPNNANFCTMNESITERHMDGNKSKAQEHDEQNDSIKISSAYSPRLLSNLTQALQSSGLDLSQATISVKIDIGKQPNGITLSASSNAMEPNLNKMTHD